VAGGQISPSPIDFHRRPYNTLALPCERVMMHGSEWTLKYDEPEVENVARLRSLSATFSTEGYHISMSHE